LDLMAGIEAHVFDKSKERRRLSYSVVFLMPDLEAVGSCKRQIQP
jgi:hypothetical protein